MQPTDYALALAEALQSLKLDQVEAVAARLEQARRDGKLILVCGNGGSAATAQHLVNDLAKLASVTKNPPFRALCLSDNTALVTAWANDQGYERAFAGPLRNLAQKGDILIAISTSGASENVLAALLVARRLELTRVVLTGAPDSKAALLADLTLATPGPRTTIQEDVASVVCHMLAEALRS